jgi:hypothetical protein
LCRKAEFSDANGGGLLGVDIVDENRRTPDEMAMLEVLEPGMKEIVVEGRGDQAILRWFLKLAAPQADIDVFAVEDRVLLNEDTIASHGYNIGRRGSVITLAEIVHAEHSDGTRLRFVADRDFNALGLDECPELPNLYFTDFTSMELYFFAEK